MSTLHIYTLSDPVSGEVRYVGLTVSPDSRLASHLSLKGQKANRMKRKWMADLKRQGLQPSMSILETIEEDLVPYQQRIVERKWIQKFLAQGADLLNAVDNPTYEAKVRQAFGPPIMRRCVSKPPK